jgi:chromate transporter
MVPIKPRRQAFFVTFFRLGVTAHGGPAMMAHLRQERVGKRQWLTDQEFKPNACVSLTRTAVHGGRDSSW